MPKSRRQPDSAARPQPAKRPRSEVIRLRATREEAALAKELAESLGVTVSAALCASLRWAAGASPGRLEPFLNELAALRLELGRIGVNINQLAHAANSNRRVTVPEGLLNEMREIATTLARFIMEVQYANHARLIGLDGAGRAPRAKGPGRTPRAG